MLRKIIELIEDEEQKNTFEKCLRKSLVNKKNKENTKIQKC